MNFNTIPLPLTENQIEYIKNCGTYGSPAKLILSKAQLAATGDENLIDVPLTTFQMKLVDQARAGKVDLSISLNLQQEQEFLKNHFDLDIDIVNASLFYQKNRRVFRR